MKHTSEIKVSIKKAQALLLKAKRDVGAARQLIEEAKLSLRKTTRK